MNIKSLKILKENNLSKEGIVLIEELKKHNIRSVLVNLLLKEVSLEYSPAFSVESNNAHILYEAAFLKGAMSVIDTLFLDEKNEESKDSLVGLSNYEYLEDEN